MWSCIFSLDLFKTEVKVNSPLTHSRHPIICWMNENNPQTTPEKLHLLKLNVLSFQHCHSKQIIQAKKNTLPTNKILYLNSHTYNRLKVKVGSLAGQKSQLLIEDDTLLTTSNVHFQLSTAFCRSKWQYA